MVILDIATSMLALGMALVLSVYYWGWWRGTPDPAAEGAVAPGVIVAFSVWIGLKTIVPMATTIATPDGRGWRVPLNVIANLVVSFLVYGVCRALAAEKEGRTRGR